MKRHKDLLNQIFLFICLSFFLGSTLLLPQPAESITGLIVTGQSTHNWRDSSSALKQMLENTGRFQIDTAVCESGQENEFSPDFSRYDLVVINYKGPPWSQTAQEGLEKFVSSGGGLVIFHSSSQAFPEWEEYNKMAGLGGWEGRSQDSGPYVYWDEGRIVREDTPGIAGYHGPGHAFPVAVRELFHPITRGIPTSWMHAEDDLYSLLRGPAENLTVLATAYSDPAFGGSGRHEPVLFTIRYGQGRVFHTVLGHASGQPPFPALECAGFIVTFQRGAEWAASGRVTQEVPADFPACPDNSNHPDFVRTWSGYTAPHLEDILKELADYREGQNDDIVLNLRDYVYIRRHAPESLRAVEEELASFLNTDATLTGKMEACRVLRTIGTSNSVAALKQLMFQEDGADEARYALEEIPGDDADDAFIEALEQFDGDKKLGIISSMGNRNSSTIITALIRVFNSGEQPYSDAAATALGRIGHPEAADALCRVVRRQRGEARPAAVHALLNAVQFGVIYDCFEDAGEVYARLQSFNLPLILRQAAVRGWILTHRMDAAEYILDILRGQESGLHPPAIEMIPEIFTLRSAGSLIPLLEELPPASRTMLLSQLGHFPFPEMRNAVLASLDNPEPAVRMAALNALAEMGDDSSVDPVARFAAAAQGPEKEAARRCLAGMTDSGINQAVLTGFVKCGNADVKQEYLLAIKNRQISQSRTLLFQAMSGEIPEIKAIAAEAFREFAQAADLPGLIQIYTDTENETVLQELQKTIAVSASHIMPPEDRGDLIVQHLDETQDPESKASLLQLLPAVGDNSTLIWLREALESSEPEMRETAVRALAGWPDDTPMFDLFDIAEASTDTTIKVLALRGFIRMVGDNPHMSPSSAIEMLRRAREITDRPEEWRLILGILPHFAGRDALEFAQSFADIASVQAEAEIAIEKIQEKIEKR
jgi:HEAT repeat protein/type 1 glutamine amidotransferase